NGAPADLARCGYQTVDRTPRRLAARAESLPDPLKARRRRPAEPGGFVQNTHARRSGAQGPAIVCSLPNVRANLDIAVALGRSSQARRRFLRPTLRATSKATYFRREVRLDQRPPTPRENLRARSTLRFVSCRWLAPPR